MSQTPSNTSVKSADQAAVTAAVEVLSGQTRRGGLGRLWPFLGPAFVASVAYVDPGNYATNLESGARLGYTLLWVVLAANLTAMLIQSLSAKLGIATGHNLAELCRLHYPPWLVWTMWVAMEVVAMATDLAEFLGAALGLFLLFGMPLWIAGLVTAAATFGILTLERLGFRPMEAVITVLVGVIAACYLAELAIAQPDWHQVAYHSVVPGFGGSQGVVLATGILGATVMPHVIFLHSALMQGRIVTRQPGQMKRLFRFEVMDVVLAMGVAGLINAAMLVMAARAFHDRGAVPVDSIEKAYLTLQPLLGQFAGALFALSLLASGLSSSAVGTMSGQVIMQGFLKRHIPIWVRRLVTMAPALAVILIGFNATKTLILSQVVLSLALPLAVVPLVLFTRRGDLMGVLVNRRSTTVLAWAAAGLIIALNAYLLVRTIGGGFTP
ncbi:MAG: Nramp family divalent metal transporter [Planctomycetota bacterium]|nr:Nramp family divalent metal transporter [Planctomycetota bacterium]